MATDSRFSPPKWLARVRRHVATGLERYAWVLVAVNLAGTAVGAWYYLPQLRIEPLLMWPVVPDSPVATLLMALAITLYKLDRPNEYINVLAFMGLIKFGLWAPYVLLVFQDGFLAAATVPPPIQGLGSPAVTAQARYGFLFITHLGMVLQAGLLLWISRFPRRAVIVATLWYGFNDVVDYFVPIVGTPHHSRLPVEPIVDGTVQHISPAHELAAGGALVATAIAVGSAMYCAVSNTTQEET